MGGGNQSEVFEIVNRRQETLSHLADSPHDKRGLADEIGVSPSTVYRSVRELEAVGLVVQRDGEYRLTPAGRILYGRFSDFMDSVSPVADSPEIFNGLPAGCLVSDALSMIDVYPPTAHDPQLPLRKLANDLPADDHLRIGSPSLSFPMGVPEFEDRLRENQFSAEIVLPSNALDELDSNTRVHESLAIDSVVLRGVEEPPPLGIVLVPSAESVYFVVRDDGRFTGVVRTEADASVAWAREQFESSVADADRWTPE
jgi:DNA-binding transcriptional LysR family regulator